MDTCAVKSSLYLPFRNMMRQMLREVKGAKKLNEKIKDKENVTFCVSN